VFNMLFEVVDDETNNDQEFDTDLLDKLEDSV